MIRNVLSTAAGAARVAVDKAVGHARGLARRGPKDLDDVTLARKVESIVFRGPDSPKDKVDVNVAAGVVELRGEVRTPEAMRDLVARVRAIPEVRDVHDLLHLPRTPATTRADAPGRARRRTPESKEKRPRTGQGRLTAERGTASAEPGPAEKSAARTGRTAAPMGSRDE